MSKTITMITPVLDKLLRGDEQMPVGLYHLHLATAAQLTRLHYSIGSYKTIRQRLHDLAEAGYIVIDAIPEKFHRGPNYYTLGTKGFQYVAGVGMNVDKSLRAAKETNKGYLHIQHLLELNDVLIAALRASTIDPRLYVARYEHERELKRKPYKVMLQGQTYGLVPDGFIDFHMKREGRSDLSLPVLLEHDRGFEREHQFKQKIAAYRAFLSSGAYKEQFKVEGMTVLVTIFTSLQRMDDLYKWTRDELSTDPITAGRFRFGLLPRPPEPKQLLIEKRWYTLAGDQRIALVGG
jgi:hypothetical protein